MSEEDSRKKNRGLCGLCEKNQGRYCCPRCEVFYCSLDCYKSDRHLECSENFYKECVSKELALNTVDDDSKSKMIEILNRMQNEELEPEEEFLDSDDDNEIDLPTRLQNIKLDDADSLWSALTNDERNEFQSLLNGSTVGDIVPHWEPWWMYRKEKKLVEDLQQPNNEENILNKCPIIKVVPKFSTLTNVKPAPSIRVNIINVLAAYSFVMRYFNGEVEPVEAVVCILNICDSLNSNSNFEEPDLAVEAVTQKCLQSVLIETDEESLEIMRHDTFLLYQGPNEENSLFYTKSAISDLIDIFSNAKSKSKIKTEARSKGDFSRKFPEHDNSHLPSLDISKVKKCIKKLEFYLSFLNTCGK
ncbi:zinc finger HIT domain-containing protein 2 [Pieris brassicae]|uniref:zinc finger HIT domain-containing protein 2 n=1 Tax=Pieris brassicae TaxID=7116 RepID=UPI001E65ECC7|nr:zinc finger HIT domain-containing protein 2 [Pieris brassicae]